MVKNHLKRLATPRTWGIKRKKSVFITKPQPGAHSKEFGISLNTLFKEELEIARTTKEVKKILHDQEVLIDGKRRRTEKYNVGFMDVISFPLTKEHYRMSFSKKGKLTAFKIKEEEANKKLVRITGKKTIKGNKTQLTMGDGKTIIIDKNNYKVNDVLEIELPSQKIIKHIPFKKGSNVLIIKGQHSGQTGTIEEINEEEELVTVKTPEKKIHTKSSYILITGDKKPLISVVP